MSPRLGLLRLVVFPLSLLLATCEESVTGPEVIRLPHGEVSAEYNGLKMELLRYNLSWFPRDDSPFPGEDEVFTTFLVRLQDDSAESRTVGPVDFGYRTIGERIGETPGKGPVWDPVSGGRTPSLEDGSLDPGEEVEQWLTFRVPKGEYPDELLWSPHQDLMFAIYLPPGFSASRIQHSLVFGTARDPDGDPVADAEVRVTAVTPAADSSGEPSMIGNCFGFPGATETLQTNSSGSYTLVHESAVTNRFCIDVLALAPIGSGLVDQGAGGGIVIPGPETRYAEPPEIRIDVVLAVVP